MLVVRGDSMELRGTSGGKLFRKGREPAEMEPGASLDELLH